MKPTYLTAPALVLTSLLGAGGALAQPSGGMLPDDPDEPQPVLVTPPSDPPPPSPEPRPSEPPPPEPPPAAVASAPTATRPAGYAIGLGLGYVIPADLATPNRVSARFRMGSGLTFEPTLVLAVESDKSDDGIDSFTSSTSDLELGVLVRYPLRSRGRVDLSLIGSAGIAIVSTDPDGDDNDRTTSGVTVGWGLALDYWLTSHWDISLTAGNPVFTTISETRELGAGMTTEQSSTTFGAIFDPTLAVMLHLYL